MEHQKPKKSHFQVWVVTDPDFDEHRLRETYIGEFKTELFDIVINLISTCYNDYRHDYTIFYSGCERDEPLPI